MIMRLRGKEKYLFIYSSAAPLLKHRASPWRQVASLQHGSMRSVRRTGTLRFSSTFQSQQLVTER